MKKREDLDRMCGGRKLNCLFESLKRNENRDLFDSINSELKVENEQYNYNEKYYNMDSNDKFTYYFNSIILPYLIILPELSQIDLELLGCIDFFSSMEKLNITYLEIKTGAIEEGKENLIKLLVDSFGKECKDDLLDNSKKNISKLPFVWIEIKPTILKLIIDKIIESNPDLSINKISEKVCTNLYHCLNRKDSISLSSYICLRDLAGERLLTQLYGAFEIPFTYSINTKERIKFYKPKIIEKLNEQKDLVSKGKEPIPLYILAENFNVSQGVIQRIAQELFGSDLYNSIYPKGGKRDFEIQRINEHIEQIVDFFKQEYSTKKWIIKDSERFEKITQKLKADLDFEKEFHINDLNVLDCFYKSIPYLDSEYEDKIILFKNLYSEFYEKVPSRLYISLIDNYLGGRKKRKKFFIKRQQRANYKRIDYSDPLFRAKLIPQHPWGRIKSHFDLICPFLKSKYKIKKWNFNSPIIPAIIDELFKYFKQNLNDFKEQPNFHATDKNLLFKFINAIPLIEENEWYKLNTLNKIYQKVYKVNKNANNKFRDKIDAYFEGKSKRQLFFFLRSLQLYKNEDPELYQLLVPKYVWSEERVKSIKEPISPRIFKLLNSITFTSLFDKDPEIPRCSEFIIKGDNIINVYKEEFEELVKELLDKKIIIKNSDFGELLIKHTKNAMNTYSPFDMFFSSEKHLIHSPLLKYIYYTEPSSLGIEIPIEFDFIFDSKLPIDLDFDFNSPKIMGHIDLLSYYKDQVHIVDFKPEETDITKFRSLPQICAYGFILKNKLNLKESNVKCVTFNTQEAWEYNPYEVFPYIIKFLNSLDKEHPLLNKNWIKYFNNLGVFFMGKD